MIRLILVLIFAIWCSATYASDEECLQRFIENNAKFLGVPSGSKLNLQLHEGQSDFLNASQKGSEGIPETLDFSRIQPEIINCGFVANLQSSFQIAGLPTFIEGADDNDKSEPTSNYYSSYFIRFEKSQIEESTPSDFWFISQYFLDNDLFRGIGLNQLAIGYHQENSEFENTKSYKIIYGFSGKENCPINWESVASIKWFTARKEKMYFGNIERQYKLNTFSINRMFIDGYPDYKVGTNSTKGNCYLDLNVTPLTE